MNWKNYFVRQFESFKEILAKKMGFCRNVQRWLVDVLLSCISCIGEFAVRLWVSGELNSWIYLTADRKSLHVAVLAALKFLQKIILASGEVQEGGSRSWWISLISTMRVRWWGRQKHYSAITLFCLPIQLLSFAAVVLLLLWLLLLLMRFAL